MRQKNKNWENVIIMLALLLIGIHLSAFFYKIFLAPLETRIVDAKFSVGNNIGFDLNSTSLSFGKITPGGSAKRSLKLSNEFDYAIKVRVLASRKIADYISVKEESFLIEPKTLGSIEFTLNIPRNMKLGDYSGKVLIKIYKAK